ncbi:MAG: hypothetical protein ACFE9T_01010 [Promethearchaeota archaeon]
MFYSYFDALADAIEFLVALGSVMGLLGLIVGILGYMFSSGYFRHKFIGIIIFSFILLAVCGVYTGINYFHLDVNI